MLLRVGPFVYRVKVVSGYIQFEGDDCLGLCDNETHELLVSDRCSPAQQVQVICHEYMEAWTYHFGQGVMDKEAWCDLFGLAMTQFIMDLMKTLRLEGGQFIAAVTQTPPATETSQPSDDDRPKRATRQRRTAVSTIKVRDGLPQIGPSGEDLAVWRATVMDTLTKHLEASAKP